jgi:RNA polymerase sigma factor (sigma-70 family)
MRTLAEYRHPISDAETRRLITITRDPALTDADHIEARNTILASNIGWRYQLACRAIKHWTSEKVGIEPADLADEGMIGEIRAIARFDVENPVLYLTFATYWIVQSINSELRKHSRIIFRPLYLQQLDQDLSRRKPVKATPMAIKYAVTSRWRIYSLNSPTGHEDDGYSPLEPEIEDDGPETVDYDDTLAHNVLVLRDALNYLDERSRMILTMRSQGIPLKTIGQQIGLTRERIRQIEHASYKQIRVYMEERGVTA